MRRSGALLFVLSCVAVVCAATPFRLADAPARPVAARGEIDLRDWDFSARPSLSLEGEWEFFPGQLDVRPSEEASVYRCVPDHWDGDEAGGSGGRGAGTYRLTVLLPADHPPLALRWWTASTACEIAVDGRSLAKVGRPAIDAAHSEPSYRPGIALMDAPGPKMILSARVSNHEYRTGGLWTSFRLGSLDAIGQERIRDISVSLALAAVIFATGLASLLFFLYNRRLPSALYFALLAFVVAFRPLVIGDYCIVALFPGLGYDALIRLEYFTIFGTYAAGVSFFLSLFGLRAERRLAVVLLAPALPFALMDAFAPIGALSFCLFPFLAVIVPLFAYLCIRLAPIAFRDRELGSWPMVGGTLVIFVGAMHDAVSALMRRNAPSYIVWALGLFVLFQAALLARLYSHSQRHLELIVTEKDSLLIEVQHRVRNGLQIVSSILAMQANRSIDSALKAAYCSIQDRIRAISLAHDHLYRVGTSDRVDLSSYCAELLKFMDDSCGDAEGQLRISLEVESVEVPAGLCIDCGLILTELIGGVFDHAPGKPAESVSVAIHPVPGGLEIEGSECGSPRDSEQSEEEGFSLRIIKALVDRYHGSLVVSRGAVFSVRVRLETF